MKNEGKRNLFAISAQFRKAGSHKAEKYDKKEVRRQARLEEQMKELLTDEEYLAQVAEWDVCVGDGIEDE